MENEKKHEMDEVKALAITGPRFGIGEHFYLILTRAVNRPRRSTADRMVAKRKVVPCSLDERRRII